jgi:hypothetical protein
MKNLLIFSLLNFFVSLSFISEAQNKKLIQFILSNQRANSGYGAGDSISTSLFSDRVNVVRDGSPKNFTLNVPLNFFSSWVIRESRTQIAVASGSGLSGLFTGDFNLETVIGFESLDAGVKFYDLEVTATKQSYSFKRKWRRHFSVLPATFTEGQADAVWNLTSGVAYQDNAGVDRPGYQIYVKGDYTGAGYLGMEQFRSTDPSQPIHILFEDGSTLSSTAAWLIRVNFDCQNIILDATNNSEQRYAMQAEMTDSGGQMVIIEPADVGAGSTLSTAGKNITFAGFKLEGGRFCSSGINLNTDNITGATINYDTWTIDGINIFNNEINSTFDEGIYLGRFNDQLVSGYAKPRLKDLVLAYNTVDDSGADGFQIGPTENGEIHNNIGTDLNWRNATDHRNLLQVIGNRDSYLYHNEFYNNQSEGGSSTWNFSTGRGGSNLNVWGNLFRNLYTGAHANGFILIEENEYDDTIEDYNIFNNTIILYNNPSVEVWRSNTGVATVLSEFRLVDNAILNLNNSNEITYTNSPNTSGYTIDNLFSQSSSSFGFTDYDGGDYSPASTASALFAARTAWTKNHPMANYAIDGYEFKDDIQGGYSGVKLQIQETFPDVTAPTISGFTIQDANPNRIYFQSSEVITGTTYSGFTVASPSKIITALTINAGQTTGHYFTVDTDFVGTDNPTISYSGSGSNIADASSNTLASFTATFITNNIVDATPVDLKVNIFTGTASGWIATGSTAPSTSATTDYGQLGSTGIGIRSTSDGGTYRWNTTGTGGTTTGNNTGVFPDAVMLSYWYASGTDIGRLEFYNHTGTPLNDQTFTIRIHGGRAAAPPRTGEYRINGGSWIQLEAGNNTANVAEFTGVSAVAGVITIECRVVAGGFVYINGVTILSE